MTNDKKLKLNKLGNNMRTYLGKPANVVTIVFLIILTLTVVLPLVSIFVDSFTISTIGESITANLPLGSFTGAHWKSVLFDGEYNYSVNTFWRPLGNSIGMSLVACLVAVLGGGVTAWFITRSNLPCKKFISTVFVFPYVMPSWSIAMFWETFSKYQFDDFVETSRNAAMITGRRGTRAVRPAMDGIRLFAYGNVLGYSLRALCLHTYRRNSA